MKKQRKTTPGLVPALALAPGAEKPLDLTKATTSEKPLDLALASTSEKHVDWTLATCHRMMPADVNPDGNIYGGGPPCDHIDTAGCIAAYTVHSGMVVTRRMEIDFVSPIFVGDILRSYYHIDKIGNSSIEIRVKLDSHRIRPSSDGGIEEFVVPVVTARLIYVAMTGDGKSKTTVDRKGTRRS